ncbi:MAG TPA: M20 aminoacylase family protein [Rhodoblastus sp.]|nr:M20 aminoacylase family protein [Rhodoblastus sp.]
MPIVNRVAELSDEVALWRQDLHRHPELMFDVFRTAGVVEQKLKEFGCDEVVTGLGRTGVVGVIKGRKGEGRTIGLRADMDALPILEATSVAHKSETPGKMHACGHDGHTAMLLGAARYLAETRNFAGTAIVIFQPAEEGGGGGREMVNDGVMDRFKVEQVYGMHNMPGIPLGMFAIRQGPFLASADRFEVEITGHGGHAAQPNDCIDPIVAGAQMVNALQTIASRNVGPIDSVVVSVTQFHAGTANNIIPQTAHLTGTIRALKKETRALAKQRFHEIVEGVAALNKCKVSIDFEDGYPVTFNHADETEFATKVAQEIVGAEKVMTNVPPVMGAEDFSYMLEARPGAFICIGNGPTAGLHHPEYDFNDKAIPYGVSYWARLVENALAA